MIYMVDIDETICISPPSRNYSFAKPIVDNINAINKLYDDGHIVIYWTARGTGTGRDWADVTKKQFEKWGVKYHDLRFGKPVYDVFICDKAFNTESFFNE